MSRRMSVFLVIVVHLAVAIILLNGHTYIGTYTLLIFYLYGFFQRPIDRIVKKIIKVAKDPSND